MMGHGPERTVRQGLKGSQTNFPSGGKRLLDFNPSHFWSFVQHFGDAVGDSVPKETVITNPLLLLAVVVLAFDNFKALCFPWQVVASLRPNKEPFHFFPLS